MLSTNYYSDKAIFNLEKEKIFLKNWVFFGLINEFTNKNNIIKKKVFGVDVIITKNKNLFNAFFVEESDKESLQLNAIFPFENN